VEQAELPGDLTIPEGMIAEPRQRFVVEEMAGVPQGELASKLRMHPTHSGLLSRCVTTEATGKNV
jgi:hypothetical protein